MWCSRGFFTKEHMAVLVAKMIHFFYLGKSRGLCGSCVWLWGHCIPYADDLALPSRALSVFELAWGSILTNNNCQCNCQCNGQCNCLYWIILLVRWLKHSFKTCSLCWLTCYLPKARNFFHSPRINSNWRAPKYLKLQPNQNVHETGKHQSCLSSLWSSASKTRRRQ